MSQDRQSQNREYDPVDADLFDYAKLRDYFSFVMVSVWRHWRLGCAVAAVTVAIAGGVLKVLPKKYQCEMKIQAQRNQTISALTQDRALEIEAPTRNAVDLVMRTDNLISLVQKTKLAESWEAHRAPLQKLKDKLTSKLRKPMTAEQMQDMLVATLETEITVTPGEDSLTFDVGWWDAGTAYRLVTAIYENFLEARQFRETAAISEAIGLLEGRAQSEHDKVEAAVERVIGLRGPIKDKKGDQLVRVAPRAQRPLMVNPDLQRVRDSLRAKQQAITDLQESRQRHISELEAKLSEIKQVYSEFHPAVLDLVETIQRESQNESPQLHGLREEHRQLQEQYEKLGGPLADAGLDANRSKELPRDALRLTQTDEIESPEVESAKQELRYQMAHYSTTLDRIDQVTMERETQRAAFSYRYSVLRPAMMPNAPSKPKSGSVMIGAALAGLLLGIGVAVVSDLRSKVIYQRWQIERMLQLQVLAEIKVLSP